VKNTIFLLSCCFILNIHCINAQNSIKQWDRFEIVLKHNPTSNPFTNDSISAVFKNGDNCKKVRGFYDGYGTYKIRFMPDETGTWTYVTGSNRPDMDKKEGSFTCVSPSSENHGPVKVINQYHFGYSDGKPYYPFGTTVYSFIHQNDDQAAVAIAQLQKSPFNKLRFCVMPQFQDFARLDIEHFPFEQLNKPASIRKDTILWNFDCFNPGFFSNLERRIESLEKLGVEADIILFHPYDEHKWGFDNMSHETDILYLKYIVARLASYHNVWWSLANEYDFLKYKKAADWASYIKVVAQEDPYGHLCSIHNAKVYYENTNSALTHASIQNGDLVDGFGKAVILRDAYKKPVIYDEVCYEGDIKYRWGNLTAQEMTYRFWQGMIAGTYVGHGETYIGKDSVLHLIYGRQLRGQSPQRIKFLRTIVESTGPWEQVDHFWGVDNLAAAANGDYIIYFGKEKIKKWQFFISRDSKIPDGTKFEVEIIDTWNMTVTPVKGVFVTKLKDGRIVDVDNKSVKLPKKPYLALRLKKIK
jgi:hypothetical protein